MINSILPGPYCTFQGLILQVGLLAQPLWALVVAVNTFILIAGGPRRSSWVMDKSSSGKGRWFLVAGIWVFVFLIAFSGLLFIQPFHPESGPFCTQSLVGTDGR